MTSNLKKCCILARQRYWSNFAWYRYHEVIYDVKWWNLGVLMTSSIVSSSIYDVFYKPKDAKEGFPNHYTKLDHHAKLCPKWSTKGHFFASLRFSYRRFTVLQCSCFFYIIRSNFHYCKRFNSVKWLQTWKDVAYLRGNGIGLILPAFDIMRSFHDVKW